MHRVALPAVILAASSPCLAPVAAMASAAPAAPAAPAVASAQDAGKYGGLMPLVRAHKDAQDRMVALWQSIKKGDVSEKTRDDYKKAQESAQKASNKVTQFISQERWSEEDRAAMTKIWTDELEKTAK
jgi:pyruvate/2-oxoglutarate dehydrogenase complex dihydrolipoamide acyltransferase (E2) component